MPDVIEFNETNKEKGQYGSVFELKICKKIIEFIDILVILFGLFYATIRYGCKMKNDRQEKNATKI